MITSATGIREALRLLRSESSTINTGAFRLVAFLPDDYQGILRELEHALAIAEGRPVSVPLGWQPERKTPQPGEAGK